MALAGTDFAQHAHFQKAAEDYRRLINREMNMDLAYNQKDTSNPYVRGRDLWEKIPEFDYSAPNLGWVLSQQRLSVAMLAAWCLAASAAYLALQGAFRRQAAALA